MELFFRQTRKDLGIGCPEASELATGSVGQSTRGDPAVSQARLGVGYDYVMGDHKPGQQVVVCRASRSRLARLRAGGMMHDPMAQWPVRTRTRKALGWLLTEGGGQIALSIPPSVCLSVCLSVCPSLFDGASRVLDFAPLRRWTDGPPQQPASQPTHRHEKTKHAAPCVRACAVIRHIPSWPLQIYRPTYLGTYLLLDASC